jgi:hypothetical protein
MATRLAPKLSAAHELGLGLFLAAEAHVVNASPATRQHRQRIDGRFSPAKLVDQRPEGSGPDILAPDQPEPREALTMIQPRGRLGRAEGFRACFRQSESPRLA